MRVIKLIQSPIIDADGKWNVFCQVLIGNSYVYGAVICDTMQEAFAIKENQILDIDRIKFSRRTNIICK